MFKKNFYFNKNNFIKRTFGDKEFIKLFLKLSIPAVLQHLVSLSVVYVDNFMLASLLNFNGAIAKTAVGLVNPIINFSIYFMLAWISGTGIMLSQYYGNKNFLKTRETLFLRLWFSFLLLLPIFVTIITIPGLLLEITTAVSKDSLEYTYARIYLFIFGFSLIPTSFAYCFSNALVETKRQVISFWSALVGVISNIILDPIVILVFRNDPYMAVAMVSLTTLISRVIQTIFCILYIVIKNDKSLNIFNRKNQNNNFNIETLLDINKWSFFDKKTICHVFKYSLPTFFNDAFYSFAYLLMSVCFLSFGKGSESYYNAITNALLMVSFVEIIWPGMGSATSILVAAKLGEGDIRTAKNNANILLRWSFLIIVVIIIILFGCSMFINDILSPGDEDVIALSKRLQWIILPILISQGMFSSMYFSIRSGGTKLIVIADCFIMLLWAIIMAILTFNNILNNLSPELFFFILEANQLAKFIIASFIYKYSKWARNLTQNKETLWNH